MPHAATGKSAACEQPDFSHVRHSTLWMTCPVLHQNRRIYAFSTCRAEIADVNIEELRLGAPLGDGASGDVFASSFQGALCTACCGQSLW